MLTTDTYQKIIDEVHETLMYLILYFQGEPYLNPSFFDFVSYAKTKNIYSATSTNAHYLDQENARKTVESGLDRMIISLDGTDQETYEKYRVGGDFNKVIEGTKELVSQKRRLKSFTPYIILQFIVFNHNEQQISEVKKLGASIGVDSVAIKTAQIYDYENGSDLIPSQGDYARYQQNGDSRWHIKNELLNHCWKMWHSSVITWDGKVVPCCFDKDAKHVLGDASNHGFKEIWNGESYNNFRNQLMISRDEIDICKNCTEGTKVWA